jgi:hypothetical protein
MSHYVWEAQQSGSGWASAVEITGWTKQQEVQVFFGRALPDPLPRLEVTELSRGKLGDTMGTATSTRMVSGRLREVLAAALGDRIQFIEANISGIDAPPYYVANILEHFDCLDREKSDVEAFPRPPHAIRRVRKLVLLPKVKDAPPAFHLGEMPAAILVNDELRRKMESASSSAGVFIDLPKYRFGVMEED